MDQSEVIVYQLIVGIVCGVLVFFGGRFGGRYLHEQEAQKIAHGDRPDTPEARHEMSLQLAHGYKDTKAYTEWAGNLSTAEEAQGIVTPHGAEKYALWAAIAAAVLGFLASHESARIHARKVAAQASIHKTTQRFQKRPGA